MNFKILSGLILSVFVFNLQALASETCYQFPKVSLPTTKLNQSCLGRALGPEQIGWKMPRKILIDGNTLYISDMGSWSPGDGAVWKINAKTMRGTAIYRGGDRTHGLQMDSQKRLIIGDAVSILRAHPKGWQRIINGLPKTGSHPLSEILILPDNSLIVNVGAPSNGCVEEMKGGTNCSSRDGQGELRLYRYVSSKDSYDPRYRVVARGLRNSMGLEYNSLTNELYQAENNIDVVGTAEELNVINFFETSTPDFGWPFCVEMGRQSSLVPQVFGSFCGGSRSTRPLFLVPAHSAPLDMKYYQGRMFAELNGELIMGWHGWRRSKDWALVAYSTNRQGQPFTDKYVPLLTGQASNGDKFHPVGFDMDSNGAIWFVDDKLKTLFVLAESQGDNSDSDDLLPEDWTEERVQQQFSRNALDEFDQIYKVFKSSSQTCTQCHSEGQFEKTSLKSLTGLLNLGWLKPGASFENQRFIFRMYGPVGKTMPPAPEAAFSEQEPEIADALKQWSERHLH